MPIDDAHPCHPTTAYGISKRLSEEMCLHWSRASGIPSVALRPPGVWKPETYQEILEARDRDPDYEWKPYWEYGAFIDLRDLSRLVYLILLKDLPAEYRCYAVSSDDITSSGMGSRDWASRVHPLVPWVGDSEYERDPFKTLLDNSEAKRDFGWRPEYGWRRFREGMRD